MTGITPAWAGKRSSHPSGSSMAWDHPRVGGEKEKKGVKQCGMTGSPPRGRGKGCHFEYCQKGVRITPAWAGKSTAAKCCANGIRDHPRVGGEKIPAGAPLYAPCGSPPRGRGKVENALLLNLLDRITPAWAGKSIQSSGPLHTSGDHPRVGGEKGRDRRTRLS